VDAVGSFLGRALAGAVVVSVLVLVPSPAGAAEHLETQLSITAPATVRIGGTAAVKATLTTPGPVPVPGVEVVLERKLEDSSWAPVASATTSAGGVAAFSAPVLGPGDAFRAHFAGAPSLDPSLSETVLVQAAQVASALFIYGPKTLVDETSGELLMRWTGADGLPVTGVVRVYQHAKDKPWTKLGAIWTDGSGRARVTIRPRVDTWYQFRGEAAVGWQGAVSPSWKVDNKPPGAVIVLPANAPKPTPLAAQKRGIGAGANASIVPISDAVWKRMYGRSWKPGCPLGRSSLRYLTVNYWGFDGYRHRGELVVRSTAAMKFAIAMTKLYNARVPIRAMFLPDRFGYSGQSGGANDYASMRHDNTSAFNCRLVTGDPSSRSPHSYGTAIDLNPWENPFRSKDGWLPNGWWSDKQIGKYAWKRSDHLVVRLMREAGFSWPYGRYDAQHFHA
jgi:hypothetical protein